MDIADFQSVALALDAHRPWAVINAAGYVQVDRAECEADVCWRENVLGPEILARSCAARGLALVTFSSDLVFNGRRDRAYIESDRVDPTTVFGRGKVAAEERVAKLFPGALIVRTSAFFGPSGTRKWPTQMLRTLAAGDTVLARSDRIVSPTYVPDLANRTLDLLIDGESGLWHLTNAGAVSWYDAAVAVARLAGIVGGRIEAIAPDGVRPRCTALNSERGSAMPAFEHALARFVAARSWRLEASR